MLPRYRNTPYISIGVGNHFGVIDIVGSAQTQDIEMEDWYKKRSLLSRQFSVAALEGKGSEVLILNINNLHQMENDFMDCFSDLFDSSIRRLRKAWLVKLEAMKECSGQQLEHKERKKAREQALGSDASVEISSSSEEEFGCKDLHKSQEDCGHKKKMAFDFTVKPLEFLD